MSGYDNSVLDKDIIDRRVIYRIGLLASTIPVRVEGMHVCCSQMATVLATKILLYTNGEALRVRTRWHLGTFCCVVVVVVVVVVRVTYLMQFRTFEFSPFLL
jgi:hypothetical protein